MSIDYADATVPTSDSLFAEDVPPDTRSGLECDNCGKDIVWAGRGRRPKRCHDCRGTRTPSTRSTDSSGNRRGSLKLLEENLTAQIYSIGTMVAIFDQFDGVLIAKKSDRLATAFTDIAASNPKIRKALESGLDMAGWAQVAMVLGEIALPIMAHHNMIPGVPDPAQLFNQGSDNGHSPV